MIRIGQLKLHIGHTEQDLWKKAARQLKVNPRLLKDVQIRRRSIDARQKPELFYVYTVDVVLDVSQKSEENIVRHSRNPNAAIAKDVRYALPSTAIAQSGQYALPSATIAKDARHASPSATIAKDTQHALPSATIAKDARHALPSAAIAKDEKCALPSAFPSSGAERLLHRPLIVGSGPAGLFCAYALALCGYAPTIVERGKPVRERERDVASFWEGQPLDPESNVQFGEGGAGAFSDGKLNTLVKDEKGRGRFVLETFVSCGAPEQILYDAKPHVGTDVLSVVIEALRHKILDAGGQFLFGTCLTGLEWELRGEHRQVAQALCRQGTQTLPMPAEAVVLAIGHSARDTFQMLEGLGIAMEPKPFAVGLRVEHPQRMVDEIQYGAEGAKMLGAAPYKLTSSPKGERGVYSFCMCPGGYVVNASSEAGRLAINGMSYSGRDGANANSAILVTVNPRDFLGEGPLSGVRLQRQLEEKAFSMGNGKIPQQLYGDFKLGRESGDYGSFASQTKGAASFAPLHELLAPEIGRAFVRGMEDFDKRMPGFGRYDCILSGVESRSSSPVRILRDGHFESDMGGLYPCGEGAGYAGGILSAAMDGLKVAEAIVGRYAPPT